MRQLALFFILIAAVGCSSSSSDPETGTPGHQGSVHALQGSLDCNPDSTIAAGTAAYHPFDACALKSAFFLGDSETCMWTDTELQCWERGTTTLKTASLKNPRAFLKRDDANCVVDDLGFRCATTGRELLVAPPQNPGAQSVRFLLSDLHAHDCVITAAGTRCYAHGPKDKELLEIRPTNDAQIGQVLEVAKNCALTTNGFWCIQRTGSAWDAEPGFQWIKSKAPSPLKSLHVNEYYTCGLSGDEALCWRESPPEYTENKLSSQLLARGLKNPQGLASVANEAGCALTDDGVTCFVRSDLLNAKDHADFIEVPRDLVNPRQLLVRKNKESYRRARYEACALTDHGLVCWGDQLKEAPLPKNAVRKLRISGLFSSLDGDLCVETLNEVICEGTRDLAPGRPSVSSSSCVRTRNGFFCQDRYENARFFLSGSPYTQARFADTADYVHRYHTGSEEHHRIVCHSTQTGVSCQDVSFPYSSRPAHEAPANLGAVRGLAIALPAVCAITQEQSVRCWYTYVKSNNYTDSTTPFGEIKLPVEVSSLRDVQTIAGRGDGSFCASHSDGVVCWNLQGLLGQTQGLTGVRATNVSIPICGISDQGAFCANSNGETQFVLKGAKDLSAVSLTKREFVCGTGPSGLRCENSKTGEPVPFFLSHEL